MICVLSAILAILKAVAVFGIVGVAVGFLITYGVPLLSFAVSFIGSAITQIPAWASPFVLFSVGLSVVCLLVRLL